MTTPPTPPVSGDQPPGGPDNQPPGGPDSQADQANAPPPLPGWARKPVRPGEVSESRLAQYIGPKWETSYRKKLLPFVEDPAFVPTWNWAAALFGSLWFLYRKLYLAFAAFVFLPGIAYQLLTGGDVQLTRATVQDPANAWLVRMNGALVISAMIAAGGTANWLLFRRARAAIRLVGLQALPEPESVALLQRIGGVNRGAVALVATVSAVSLVAAFFA